MFSISNLNATLAGRTLEIDEAFRRIRDSRVLVASMGASEPIGFFTALGDQTQHFANRLRVYCANPSRSYACFNSPGLEERLEMIVMFLTAQVRDCQGRNQVHYIPMHLSRWAEMMTRQAIDVFWGSCSPPDERGFVSLGPSATYETEVLRAARTVILEINPQLPVTFGSTQVSLRDVDFFVTSDQPLPTLERPTIGEIDRRIAAHIAELVPEHATLQLGIGAIPNAVGEALLGRQDLGVHTEMINDTLMDLYLRGAVSGAKKTRWPGKIIGAFALGTPDLYAFIDRNPLVELHPASIVNDIWRLGLNHRQTSINSAVEIDLTGQVCSESIGHQELSGIGGASETHIGAQRSPGGRGIVALHSRTSAGASKIVFELKPGAKVSISRNDIDTVVTEYGAAQLRGKTVAERIRAMVAIAHPDVRKELLGRAHGARYI